MGLDGVLGFAGGGIDAKQYCGGLGGNFCSTAATLAVQDFGASFFGHGCEAFLIGQTASLMSWWASGRL